MAIQAKEIEAVRRVAAIQVEEIEAVRRAVAIQAEEIEAVRRAVAIQAEGIEAVLRVADLPEADTEVDRQAVVLAADLPVVNLPDMADTNTFHPVPQLTSLTVRRLRKEPPALLKMNMNM